MIDTWTCHICGQERPDAKISVHTTDLSEQHGLPAGTMKQNVRYCNDNVHCINAVPTFKFGEKNNGTI